MCVKTETPMAPRPSEAAGKQKMVEKPSESKALAEPSMLARYTCASILMGIFAIWGKFTFVEESELRVGDEMHSYLYPMGFTAFYLVSLPLLRRLVDTFVTVDMKLLLTESMILYNAAQVLLNGWMVYRFLDAVILRGHPFVGAVNATATGASYTVWVHYCDKYLEFLDTYFMVLRGKMDQVSFLHVYHHFTIAWAWWLGIWFWPQGDCYFGALLNSLIHVMMYSYYTMTLMRISCPWKKYLTMAQLAQFTTVVIYSAVSFYVLPSETEWKHFAALACQCGEMISLFLLFLHFYRKKYNNNKKSSGAENKAKKVMPRAPASPVRTSESSDTSDSESD